MFFRLAADLVLLTHFAFIVLVIGGAIIVFRYPWFAWLHIPAAVWGAYVEITGKICPLTILENFLRISAGQEGYTSSFVERYIVPLIYPVGLTRNLQFWLAGLVVGINVILYGWVLWHRHRRQHQE